VDEWTRECLAVDVAGSIRSGRVIDVLSRLVSPHGAPKYGRLSPEEIGALLSAHFADCITGVADKVDLGGKSGALVAWEWVKTGFEEA
jgi:hypothetical protein